MLPPGPAEPPAIQSARWLLRPISFMESSRRRFGEAFSVRFLGFRTPMVMVSDPAAIRELYTERRHGLPPGRGVALLPVVGPRSVLLLEGPEHLARRKLMLPPFHGERMRAYEATVREVVERDLQSWPRCEAFAVHPRMQAVLLEAIAARRHSPGEDILSLLLQARFEDGEPMSDQEVCDQLVTLLVAGHE